MNNSWKTAAVSDLISALRSLKTDDEITAFLRDLLTLEELTQAAARWQAVLFIDQGLPYREIAEKTGLSTTTVSRVAFWLQNGENGYQTALSRIAPKK